MFKKGANETTTFDGFYPVISGGAGNGARPYLPAASLKGLHDACT